MKKSIRVYVSIVMTVLILYAASLGVSFNNVKNSIRNYNFSDMNSIMMDLYNFWENQTIYDPYSFLNEFNNRSVYPYRIAIYDEDFNEIARTGACISFTGEFQAPYEYCYIDDYLTDDIIKQINTYYDKGNFLYAFSYLHEDGRVVPVEMEYKNESGVTGSIKLTDKTPENRVYLPALPLNFDGFSFYNDYELDCYKYIDELFDSREVFEKYNIYANGEQTDESEYYSWTQVSFLEEDSKDIDDYHIYNVFLAGKIDFNSFALNSFEFHNDVKIFTAIYFAVGIVLITAAYFIMKKYQLDAAKYAFTNAAAHELKTPLAIIENQCEFILENVNSEKNIEYTRSIYNQTLRMSSLLKKLLRYNKLSSLKKIDKQKINLTEIVNAELEKYSSFAQAKEIKIISELEDTEVNANSELISLVIDNFISNAIKFSKENSEIKLILKNKKLSLINPYSGELDKNIWDMLYTEDKARGDKSTGMGLPISKIILELHRYKYGFECKNGSAEFYFIVK